MLLTRTRTLGRQRLVIATASLAALIAICALSYVGPTSRAVAQGTHPIGANASTHGVAVVDISWIFKNHARFRAAMDAMKKEMDNIEGQLKAKRDQIAKIEEERNKFNPGVEQYKKLDDQLAREMADFNVDMTRLRKDFLDREAKEYYKTYLEIVDATSRYAEARNIGLVIRFNGEPVDPNRREDVLREINKPVVFQHKIDITPDVLALLNRDIPRTPTAGQPQPGAPAPAGQFPPAGQQPPAVGGRPAGTGSMLPPR